MSQQSSTVANARGGPRPLYGAAHSNGRRAGGQREHPSPAYIALPGKSLGSLAGSRTKTSDLPKKTIVSPSGQGSSDGQGPGRSTPGTVEFREDKTPGRGSTEGGLPGYSSPSLAGTSGALIKTANMQSTTGSEEQKKQEK